MKAAALDAASATSKTVATLNESQLGKMANEIMDAAHSKKQESEAIFIRTIL